MKNCVSLVMACVRRLNELKTTKQKNPMNQELTIKLTGPKTGRDVSFCIRMRRSGSMCFFQCGSFRSDYERKEFDSRKEFTKALNKYLNVDKVCVHRVCGVRPLYDLFYGGASISREDMFLQTRELIGDAAAIQLVNLIKF